MEILVEFVTFFFFFFEKTTAYQRKTMYELYTTPYSVIIMYQQFPWLRIYEGEMNENKDSYTLSKFSTSLKLCRLVHLEKKFLFSSGQGASHFSCAENFKMWPKLRLFYRLHFIDLLLVFHYHLIEFLFFLIKL